MKENVIAQMYEDIKDEETKNSIEDNIKTFLEDTVVRKPRKILNYKFEKGVYNISCSSSTAAAK